MSEAAQREGLTLTDHQGGDVPLAQFAGIRHAVVLLPGAFTPVCTRELPMIERAWQAAGAHDLPLLAASCDSAPVLAAWRRAEGVRMPLLADFWPHGALAEALGAFDTRTGRARRTSVVIDEAGTIVHRDDAESGRPRDMDELARVLLDR